MEKTTILKLRQLESTDVSTNGSFKITLKEGITVEEGDSVRIHTAILDTTTESIVTLNEDTPITMTTIKYVTNIENGRIDAPPAGTPLPLWIQYGAEPSSTPMPDLKRYYVHNATNAGSDVYHVTGVNTRPKSVLKKKFGGIDLRCSYLDPLTGKSVVPEQIIHFPPQTTVKHLKKPFVFDISKYVKTKVFNIRNTADEFADVNMDVLQPNDVIYGNGGNPIASGVKLTQPKEETLSFTINKGTYTPAELGQIITDKMSLFNSSGFTGSNYTTAFPVNNPFLSTLAREYHEIGKIAPTGSHSLILMPEVLPDAPGGATVPNIMIPGNDYRPPTVIANDRLIGANQTSLNYDNNLKKLNFDLLHTPWYIDPGNGQAVPGIAYPSGNNYTGGGATEPIIKEPQETYSGIAFTNLTPSSFWNALGFDGSILASVTNPDPAQPITLDDGSSVFATYVSATVGQQLTGSFLGNDIVVDKGGAYTTPTQANVITSLTTPIISNRTFDTVDNDEGYYLIDVGVKFPQKMIGGSAGNTAIHPSTGSNRVQGIMGKYFTSGNFLQDTGSSAVPYTHIGLPQMINELEIRILHADGTPPDPNELGEKNSIFLEIIKPVVVNTEPKPSQK